MCLTMQTRNRGHPRGGIFLGAGMVVKPPTHSSPCVWQKMKRVDFNKTIENVT
nr:MAG TPA: hypothetical protein [Caudoviricetes sp.]